MKIENRFEAVNDDFNEFERVENKRSTRMDLHAFILLSDISDQRGCIIDFAGHDMIGFNLSDEEINGLDDNQILELVRCGVMCQEEGDLYMYV